MINRLLVYNMLRLWIGTLMLAYPLFSYGQNASTAAAGDPNNERRVVLKHADQVLYDEEKQRDIQILLGNVELHHKGMILYCDSATLNQATNSFNAYFNVHMVQGDTVSLDCQFLFYNGELDAAEARHEVVLRHLESTLLTDSLNFDNFFRMAYYFDGGVLLDGENRLTSEWGEYFTDTRKSTFNFSVELKNPDFTITSDTLHYDANTKWANAVGPSNIVSGESRIYTVNGFYNTDTETANLLERPILFNKGKRMEADSMYYNKLSGMMQGWRNVRFEDKDNKNILLGEYGEYNELTGDAMSTDKALAKEFSQGDTLFLHADTLRLATPFLNTDSAYRLVHGYPHVRAYRSDLQAVCDTLVYNSRERKMYLRLDPIVWSGARQVLGEEIIVFLNDSTVDSIYVERQALSAEQVDTTYFNQVSGQRMIAYFKEGKISKTHVDGNVCVINFPLEKDSTVLYMNYTETSHLRMYMKNGAFEKLHGYPEARGRFTPLVLLENGADRLPNFNWFDYIRPLSKYDLFEWRGKKKGTELKPSLRRVAPVQNL